MQKSIRLKPELSQTQTNYLNVARMTRQMAAYAASALKIKFTTSDPTKRLRLLTENVAKHNRIALRFLGFDLQVFGRSPEVMQKPHLLVSNHLSYLDILVLSSVQPSVFVTSNDMGEVPGLGHLAELGGSVFIERRHRGQVERDLSVLIETLKRGFQVALYPEGTSSNGDGVLPFKKSLLMAAPGAGVDILPVCIKYTHINGEPFGPSNRDSVCWYGEMDFVSHYLRLCSLKSIRAELHFLEPVPTHPGIERNELAEKSHRAISECYQEPARS